MGRAPCCDKDNVKRGPWSPEEDFKLKAYIQQHGFGGNWIALPHKVGLNRCGKSCRLRWLNYLRPNLKHGGFSEEEDYIICSIYLRIGSSQLPGRTDNDIKNYWNTTLKKKVLGKQQNRRRAGAAKQDEMNKTERYVSSATNTNANLYGTQLTAEVNHHMHMNCPSCTAHFSPGIVTQLFEQTICAEVPTIAHTNPNYTQPERFRLNLQQAFDQEMFLRDKIAAFLIERVSRNNNHAYKIPHSNDLEIAAQVSYQPAAAPALEHTAFTENQAQLQSPTEMGEFLPQNNNSLIFPAPSSISCGGSLEGNYQSAWMSTFNADNNQKVTMEAYEFSRDWNDGLYCTKNSCSSVQVLEQIEGIYGCGPSVGTVDAWLI